MAKSENSVKKLLSQFETLRELKQLRKSYPNGSEKRKSIDLVIRTIQSSHWETYDKELHQLRKSLHDSITEKDEEKKKENPPRKHLSRLQQFISIPVNIFNFVKSTLK